MSTPGTWSIDLTKWAEKAKGNMETVIKKVALDAFSRVILKTPVDTGRARANWSVAIGRASMTSPSTVYVDKTGAATIGAAKAKVFDWNAQGSIFLCNNLPYIGTLEYGGYPNPPKYGSIPKGLKKGANPNGFREFRSANGFSYQAPQGMVRVTMAEFDAIVNDAASEVR